MGSSREYVIDSRLYEECGIANAIASGARNATYIYVRSRDAVSIAVITDLLDSYSTVLISLRIRGEKLRKLFQTDIFSDENSYAHVYVCITHFVIFLRLVSTILLSILFPQYKTNDFYILQIKEKRKINKCAYKI